jgi:hypothetical protein
MALQHQREICYVYRGVLDTRRDCINTLYSRTLEILLKRASARRRLGSFNYALHGMGNILDCSLAFSLLVSNSSTFRGHRRRSQRRSTLRSPNRTFTSPRITQSEPRMTWYVYALSADLFRYPHIQIWLLRREDIARLTVAPSITLATHQQTYPS